MTHYDQTLREANWESIRENLAHGVLQQEYKNDAFLVEAQIAVILFARSLH